MTRSIQLPSETIAAVATASGTGGVAIIRISGEHSTKILEKIFLPANRSLDSLEKWKSHHLYYGQFFSPEGTLLDEGLVCWMKAPHSFTGEDVIELHLHGGKLISQKTLETIYRLGAQPAEPGEFSKRAFLNGKIDLMQAEGIADMIAAQSEASFQLAQKQWKGELSVPVQLLRHKLMEILVQCEAAIDFPEEEIEIIDRDNLLFLLKEAADQVKKWLKDYEWGKILREGLIVPLVGRPNVGKSSLLNQLVGEEAAIVHDEPGTTRDTIERKIVINGLIVHFVDTAGIREADQSVEKKGIERSKKWLEKADLLLVLLDSSVPLEKEDFEILQLSKQKQAIYILNKTDLQNAWNEKELEIYLNEKTVSTHLISAKNRVGIEALENKIFSFFKPEDHQKEEHLFINRLRHRQLLEEALSFLISAEATLKNQLSSEFIAVDVQRAIRSLGEMIGFIDTEEVLGEIFGRFCIGK